MKLTDRIALVTGGSRGIGKACALALAEAGADIVINFYPGLEGEAEETVREIQSLGRDAFAVAGDVTSPESVDAFVTQAQGWKGRIDILVNNAGITRDGLLIRMSEEDWDRVLGTNLKGAFLVTKAVSKGMMKQRYGRIVNISSIIGVEGNAGQANYAASKAGLIGFTKSVAKELAARNVLANAVAPGFIESDMTRKLSEEVRNASLGSIPMNRFGQPEEVAELVVFLAGTSYITGQVVPVDGGMHM